MEIISTTTTTSFFSTTTPPSSLNILTKKTLLKLTKTPLKPFSIPSFSTFNYPLLIPRIVARFGRPRKRRNSLRKKLTGDDTVIVNDNDNDFKETSRGVSDGKVGDFENDSTINLGESALKNKLEGWVELYKKDIEFWGIGSNPIFVIFQDSSNNNKVDKVLVDEDEILRRNGVDPFIFRKASELEEFNEVNSKISHARFLAREVESGNDIIPRNSSVAKFMGSGKSLGLISKIKSISIPQNVVIRVSRVGIAVFCGVLFVWTMKKLLGFEEKEAEVTSFEKEMLRRKMKAGMEKEKMQKGSVEIVEEVLETADVLTKRPQLDKDSVLDGIRKAKGLSSDDLALVNVGGDSAEMDFKIKEIQMMAKCAREIEKVEGNDVDKENLVKMKEESLEGLNLETYVPEEHVNGHVKEKLTEDKGINGISKLNISESRKSPVDDSKLQKDGSSELAKDLSERSMNVNHESLNASDLTERGLYDVSSSKMKPFGKKPLRRMPKIICSVKEAREYLSQKNDKTAEVGDDRQSFDADEILDVEETEAEIDVSVLNRDNQKEIISPKTLEMGNNSNAGIKQSLGRTRDDDEMFTHSNLHEQSNPIYSETESQDVIPDASDGLSTLEWLDKVDDDLSEKSDLFPGRISSYESSKLPSDEVSHSESSIGETREEESWLEKNFHEMEPIVNKMRSGFRDNYAIAREKVKQEVDTTLDFKDLTFMYDNDTELEWMKNDSLREIVFKVRDNELAGRDPFHSMSVDDKAAFFKGLENEVDKENDKLATLHQWLHSNIENIDYGADGISIFDPPEKVMPRWKGPPLDDFPEFLTSSENKQQEASSLQKGNQSMEHNNPETSSQEASITKPKPEKKISKYPKTVIEGSDGSFKPGKRSGKEYWQHTKKLSRGFVESYNAENDPEVKSTMKDIGKDLDRWITEKEIKEAGDLMDKIPEKGKAFIDKKINKLKREMEMFGPQAVVSKYREYADEKEEDYLWWLDLPHVLCIEMYTYEGEGEGEDVEVGFYTLEMAEDLELEPKPQHVIAFQDPGDCKNFCYIIQAHLEMLGKGKAFIVPQHPKDVFRQAKANGFGVTVIRKGEVQLNVDQTLEEVEELISEIGSKMYHDQIMKERSVDINSLMKGVFGLNKPIKMRRKKRALRRPRKP